MPSQQWARLKTDADFRIRRGAWYRVLKLSPLEAVLEVRGKPVPVPRPYLDLELRPPMKWSVVPRPRHAIRVPSSWGEQYAVCPNCRERSALTGSPASLRCRRCNGTFEVAWTGNGN